MNLAPRLAAGLWILLAAGLSFGQTATAFGADLWAASTFTSGVFRIDDQTGDLLPNDIPSGYPTGSAGLNFATGVTVGPDGNVYVSSQLSGEILFYDGVTGAPLTLPDSSNRPGLFATLVDEVSTEPGPGHLVFGPDGNLYVGDFNGYRVRVFNGTTGSPMPDAGVAFTNVGGLAFGADGDLYIGDFSGANVIRMHGGEPQVFVAPQAGGLYTPAAMLFTPSGDLLVVDLYGNQVLRYDSSGQPIYRFAPEDVDHENPLPFISIQPPVTFPLPDGVTVPSNNPSDIAFDKDGNLVVSVLGLTYPPDNRGAIYRYDLDGNLLQTIASGLPPIGSISFGWAAAVPVPADYDGDGTVDAADYGKWRQDYGKFVARHLGADGSGDGVVGASDYVLWRKALPFAATAYLSADIPEPTAFGSLFLAATLAIATRHRRR